MMNRETNPSVIARRLIPKTRRSSAWCERIEPRLFLSASTIDTTFNGTGKVVSFFDENAYFTAVTVLPDNKILAVGTVDTFLGSSNDYDFLIARYTAAGKLDTTFGGGDGWTNTQFPAFAGGLAQDTASAVIQLPGGKFAVAGKSQDPNNSKSDFAVAVYTANGTLDSSFSGGGRVTTDFAGGSDDVATALALTSDNKLLVVGTTRTQGSQHYTDIAAARYNMNGSLDNSFSGDGKMNSDAGTVYGPNPNIGSDDKFADQAAAAVSILPNGTFVVAGSIAYSPDAQTVLSDFYLARFTITGALDTAFGGGKGYVQTDTGAADEGFTSMAMQPDGKIIAGGAANISAPAHDYDFALLRFNANGTKDTSFGISGVRKTNFTGYGTADDAIESVLLQPNGKIVAVGRSHPDDIEQPTRIAVARYTASGAPDTSFSGDGKFLDGTIGGGSAAALDSLGRLVVVGSIDGFTAAACRFGTDYSPSASIAGTFYSDKNKNGVKNTGEGGLSGFQAFIDSNNDGFYTPGEKLTTSDSTGFFQVAGLVPGTYRLREIRPDGWTRTQPAGAYPLGYYDVTLTSGLAATGKNFGNFLG